MVVAGAELVLVADRGGGGGDLAELHEVAVVADLVVAELVVVAELHEVAVVADRVAGVAERHAAVSGSGCAARGGAPARDARLEVSGSPSSCWSPMEHDTRR